MDNSEIYYKRGLYMIDKLLDIYTNDNSFYKKREILIEKEFIRYSNFRELVNKDIKSFTLTGLVALLGMNKENIERFDKNTNYDFDIFSTIKKREIEILKQKNPLFEKDRLLNTKYDNWLNVLNIAYPEDDYMINVRNALLHSEYNFYDNYENIIYLSNSNYTKFEGKILLPVFTDFSIFYFGNSSWSGLSENTYLFDIVAEKQIKSEQELSNTIDKLEIININYKLKEDSKTYVSPEKKIYNLLAKNYLSNKNFYNDINRIYRNNSENHSINTTKLTEKQKELVKKMLETYYGDNFYNSNLEIQNRAIIDVINYIINSRSTISEWVSDYIKTLKFIECLNKKRIEKRMLSKEFYNKIKDTITNEMNIEKDRRPVFACKTALLIIKAYHILYRLQNKTFNNIDFSKINFNYEDNEYKYTRIDINDDIIINNFEKDIQKIQKKYRELNSSEAQNKVICDIIRDALSHGKVTLDFRIENNNLKEYIVFDDTYHNKTRKLEMTLNKFENLLKSEAFTIKYSKQNIIKK